MEEQKQNFNWIRLLITVVILLVAAGVTGGTTYYVLSSNFQKERDANEKALSDVQGQLKEANTKKATVPTQTAGSTTTETKQNALSDREMLIALTVRQFNSTSYIPAVNFHKIDGDWASTSPIPLRFDSNSGYDVPGMGGSTYFWHKESGNWVYVGKGTEGGLEDAVKARLSEIPLTIIGQSAREDL